MWCIILHIVTGQKFKQNWQILGSSGQKTTQKQPKMTVSTGTKTFENLNHLNIFHLLKTEGVNQRKGPSEKNVKKFMEFIKIFTLIWLKNS